MIRGALAGREVRTVNIVDEARPPVPTPADIDALVVMGGPMGALDDAEFPGLASERRLIAQCCAAGVPVLGVCLGMQLVAVALGGDLRSGATREVGISAVDLTPAGVAYPLFAAIERPEPTRLEVLHWHGDTVSAPPGATVLATSASTPVQAFAVGNALGMQFHLEVDANQLREWLREPVMRAELSEAEIGSLGSAGCTRLAELAPAAARGIASWFTAR
ncbi:GMP synthase-like glutamine amidotransferase [Rarobacter incanus]|uniref:GMP synthase-like glutamine amidotransferase n=2 Tax=Rarobacter incanus TaxID=153494 RepID=A0A542SMV6_9MICO|nr:GMP synthase-like glutamine amidotransferase [Rarobacter incanus]